MIAPCYKCKSRHAECHAVCEKYKEFDKKNAEIRNERERISEMKADKILSKRFAIVSQKNRR